MKIRKRTRLLTPAQWLYVDVRVRELRRHRPLPPEREALRKGGIISALLEGRTKREWGRRAQRLRGPAAIRKSPELRARRIARLPAMTNKHLLLSGHKRLQARRLLTPCQAAARAGDYRRATPGGPMAAKPTDALLRDRLQVKSRTQKFETSIQKSGENIAGRVVQTRVGAGDRFTKTNRNTQW